MKKLNMDIVHKNLASGKWFTLPLMEQLGNIGSEVSRAAMAKGKDEQRFENAFLRALELFDLTLEDTRWNGRQREIARARELFCAAAVGESEYHTSLEDLDRYFLPFAIAARRGK